MERVIKVFRAKDAADNEKESCFIIPFEDGQPLYMCVCDWLTDDLKQRDFVLTFLYQLVMNGLLVPFRIDRMIDPKLELTIIDDEEENEQAGNAN